jgi:hypothetical protein
LVTSVPLVARPRAALVRAIARQLENVRTEERFAAAQHQDRTGHLGNLIDDALAASVERSSGALNSVALARQWMQRRLQPLVSSQKINRGLFCVPGFAD